MFKAEKLKKPTSTWLTWQIPTNKNSLHTECMKWRSGNWNPSRGAEISLSWSSFTDWWCQNFHWDVSNTERRKIIWKSSAEPVWSKLVLILINLNELEASGEAVKQTGVVLWCWHQKSACNKAASAFLQRITAVMRLRTWEKSEPR